MVRLLAVLVATALAAPAWSQVKCADGLPPIDRDAESRMSARDFVRNVTAKEIEVVRTFANFGYTTEASVQTLDGDAVDGEFREVSTLVFDDKGPRREVAESANTLKRIKFADRDLDTLRDAFFLTPDRMATGDIVYSGRQRIGQFNASLFDVLTRDRAADMRGFQGRTWVRARDAAPMRLCGRSGYTPIAPLRFEVVRALVGEQHWFPVLIRADENARIGNESVRVRISVKYSDYKAR